MSNSYPRTSSPPRLAPIAAGIVLMLGACAQASAASPLPREAYSPWATRYDMSLSDFQRSLPGTPPMPAGNTIVVANCNDHGTGSLRAAVTSAVSGDTVDLTQLACTITLTTGSIDISQNTLTFTGPGSDKLTIDGGDATTPAHYNRVFLQTGTGSIGISGMTLTHAKYQGTFSGFGGCVYSHGEVVITNSTLTGCIVESNGGYYAAGGAVDGEKGVILLDSIVTSNLALSKSTGATIGGGVRSFGNLTVKYSTISDNTAGGSTTGQKNKGGGIQVLDGDVYILGTTISGNYATSYAGVRVAFSTTLHSMKIFNSTISSNHAVNYQAGVGGEANTTIANSTIAFNDNGMNRNGGGLRIINATVALQSSIIAMNTAAGNLSDVDVAAATTVTGANNLFTQSVGTVPNDTITACPLLGRLANNGGTTQTHRLLFNSPALDTGNNNTGGSGSGFTNDQRGSGHPRVFNNVTDIGAFEYGGGTSDEIFRSEFENRCN